MKYFKIFSNCIVVKGHKRSTICDLQRSKVELIPNDLVFIIEELNKKSTIPKIKKEYGFQNKTIIEDYLSFLEDSEFGFYCDEDEFDRFPVLNKSFEVPSLITNAVIEASITNLNKLDNLIPKLDKLGCKEVVIVFYETLLIDDFFKIFNYFKNTRIKSFEITCKYNLSYDDEFILKLNSKVSQLTQLTFFSAKENMIYSWNDKISFDRIYSINELKSFKSCGIIDSKYFNSNLPKVTEAINYNSCLYKKISISINGENKKLSLYGSKFW